MANVKVSANHSIFGFLYLVDHFERDSDIKKHRLTEILARTKFADAADGFNKHQMIKLTGQYENVADEIINKLPALDRDTIFNGSRFLEFHCLLKNSLNRGLSSFVNSSLSL